MAGYVRQESLFHRLGLPYGTIFLPPQAYLVGGAAVVLPSIAPMVASVLGWIGASTLLGRKPRSLWPLAAACAMLALFEWGEAIIGSNSQKLSIFGFTYSLTPASYTLAVLVGLLLGLAAGCIKTPTRHEWTTGGLALVTLLLTIGPASSSGWWQANDQLWGVQSHSERSFANPS